MANTTILNIHVAYCVARI